MDPRAEVIFRNSEKRFPKASDHPTPPNAGGPFRLAGGIAIIAGLLGVLTADEYAIPAIAVLLGVALWALGSIIHLLARIDWQLEKNRDEGQKN